MYDESQLKQVSANEISFSEYQFLQLQVRYTLHAVCVHEGSATLGHFWTYVYHTDRQKWYRYNDNEGKGSFMNSKILHILQIQFVKLIGMMYSMLVLVVYELKMIVKNLVYQVLIY